jgi:hypothetical protein
LAFLCATAQQNHNPITVFAKINPVARPKIHSQFEHAGTHAHYCWKVASLQPVKRDRNARPCAAIQLFKPLLKRIAPRAVDVLTNLDRRYYGSTKDTIACFKNPFYIRA